MDRDILLACRDASLGYEHRALLEHLTFTVRAGDYLCVVGENGSGKSTLMKSLLGLLPPLAGTIDCPAQRAGAIGYLPQQTSAQRDFPATVSEVVLSGFANKRGLHFFYSAAEKSAALMNMGKLGVLELQNRCYRELSGGQQQRVLLARALCAADRLLILDEPVTGLDPAATQDLYKTLRYLNEKEKMAVIMVTHDMRGAHDSAHRARRLVFRHGGGVSCLPRRQAVWRCIVSLLLEMFTYPFILRAFAVGILVSLCAALLGVPLVLKRYSMIGDGLSHVSFGALAVAVACGFAPLAFSVPVVVASAFLLLRIAEHSRIGADAAIAVLSASALAIGIVVTSLTTGMTTDVDSYMFGSILAMSRGDVALSVTLAAAVLALFILFYHRLFAVTFDESFSRATGVKVGAYHSLLALLTALTVVLGMRMMGAMLISSLIIFPALSAMRIFKSFRAVVVCAGALSVVCFCAGLIASYLLSTPVGASVVLCNLLVFLLCCLAGRR
mgnify:CR=1 FL=1